MVTTHGQLRLIRPPWPYRSQPCPLLFNGGSGACKARSLRVRAGASPRTRHA